MWYTYNRGVDMYYTDEKIEMLRNNYFHTIMLLTDPDDIMENLPCLESKSFYPLMRGIVELLKTERDECTSFEPENQEEKEYADELLGNIDEKVRLCQERVAMYESVDLEEEDDYKAKNLVFATTSSGRVYVEEDIKNTKPEFYERIYDCFENLIVGVDESNPTKGKLLRGNDKVVGLHEVKGHQVRLFYKILDKDTVFVVLSNTKKSDKDKANTKKWATRSQKTFAEYKYIKTLFEDEETKEQIIADNKEIQDSVLGLLRGKAR